MPFVIAVCLAVCALAGCSSVAEPVAEPGREGLAPLPALRLELLELLEMQREDQLERTGGGGPPGAKIGPPRDYARAVRLEQIVTESGWPTYSQVGEEGGSAAWLVAQHADSDKVLQRRLLAAMRPAVEAGQADDSELAYLEDRVAVNAGQPQAYGTQVRCRGGKPTPATPLTDAPRIDIVRAEVGLAPLADYHQEMALPCSDPEAERALPG